MKPIEASELKAFILALYQLDSPLPDTLQAQLNTINLPGDINKLYDIAKSYLPLATSYKNVWQSLNAISKERSKGPLPAKINQAAEQQTTEINNILVAIDIQLDDQSLSEIAQPIFKASDSVAVAKDKWAIIIRSLQMP
ncbi:hypothetical protein I8751_25435 [Nostocaceae cyanobacterium CENA357]|uniref:Uncharacterized protein n=1 Tax=Atlanticothrix silvestris CENA357 TaxID=1725252 RepID=A0A8J7HI25_9CYAN|nr:hypothetical protein [Atlanticothrix silvestris]MBH8555627.1 hypothetical protein [Atlanticothrix silvestris CENA357]